MFDGRHCTHQDLKNLIEETDKFKKQQNIDYINEYLKFISRFDQEIADKMRMEIKRCNNDFYKIEMVIDILKQNVIVDINEHQ